MKNFKYPIIMFFSAVIIAVGIVVKNERLISMFMGVGLLSFTLMISEIIHDEE